jgi:hypothetical protein
LELLVFFDAFGEGIEFLVAELASGLEWVWVDGLDIDFQRLQALGFVLQVRACQRDRKDGWSVPRGMGNLGLDVGSIGIRCGDIV